MKKLYFLFFLLVSQIIVLAQTPIVREPDNVDISKFERESHQRLRDVSGLGSVDTFTMATDNIDVHHYRCEWTVDPTVRYITGKVTVSFNVRTVTDKIVFDLLTQLGVDSIIFKGNKISFQRIVKDGLQLQLPVSLSAGQKDSVVIYYKGVPDPLVTGAFYQGNYRGVPSMWTLSEPYGSKTWWPCKNGLTDKADSIDLIITCPPSSRPSSNGVVVNEQVTAGQRITHFKHRYPIASYLVAIAVSNYNVETDSVQIADRKMPILTYVYSWSTPGHYKYIIPMLKQCLQKFSELFGTYPFYKEHYCQTQWGANGGMEHQTNSFIVDRYPSLVSHELGHQWFGDKVTCGSWQDLWLNEGFATYTTNIYYENFDSALFRPTLQSQINSITSQPGGSLWVDDTTNFTRLFSNRLTYNKGSYVVHMLRWVLGDSAFFKGVRRYLDDAALRYSFARTSDLQKTLESESGKNLGKFFQKWVYGEGYPNYHAEWSQNSNNWIKLKLNQTTSHTSVNFYEMPVMVVAKSGTKEISFVVDHQFSGQEFLLNAGFPVDTIIIDPKLWILSKTKTSAKVSATATPNEIKIYPNPAPTELKISIKNPSDKKISIQLLNMLGQKLYQKEMELAGNDVIIKVPVIGLPKGIYWLRIQGEKNIQYLRKIVH